MGTYIRRSFTRTTGFLCPVVGRSRPVVVACCTVRSGVFHHWIHHLWPQGAFPPGFNPLRRGLGLSPGAWGAPKRGMPTGSEAFLELPIALGYGPATGLTLKTALCHIRTLVGRRINTAQEPRAVVWAVKRVGERRASDCLVTGWEAIAASGWEPLVKEWIRNQNVSWEKVNIAVLCQSISLLFVSLSLFLSHAYTYSNWKESLRDILDDGRQIY